MSLIDLRADCGRCAALCCIAFHFDRSDEFAFAKQAGEPCSHLDALGRCGIHARRDREGFQGCVSYECHGAGQWVTQELFGGRSWRTDSALIEPMGRAFLVVQRAHRLLALLRQAEALALSHNDRERLDLIVSSLERATSCPRTVSRLEAEARDFLPTLQRYVTDRPASGSGPRDQGDCGHSR